MGLTCRIRACREVPFGDLRIEGCVRLPGAYRSLPRPSSAPKPSHPPIRVGVLGLTKLVELVLGCVCGVVVVLIVLLKVLKVNSGIISGVINNSSINY